MINVQSNTDYVFRADFVVSGDFVSPDTGSVLLTMQRNDGVVITGYNKEPLTVAPNATSVLVNIPAADNAPTLPNEIRYLTIDFTVDDVPYKISRFYMLRESVLFPLTPDDVRALLGVDELVIPDSSIDILGAYGLVKSDAGEVDLDAIMTTGGDLLPTVIEAVRYRAAMMYVPIMQNTMFQSEQSDNTNYKRFAKVDFAALSDSLLARYAELLGLLIGTPAIPTLPVVFAKTSETDTITGV